MTSFGEVVLAMLAGAVVAAIGTPAGVSGAVFLLPVQISVLGVTGPAVSATNLLFNIVSTPLSLRRLSRRPAVDWSRLGPLIAVGVPAAVAGALARVTVLADPGRFRLLVAAVLLPLGLRLLWRSRRPRPAPAPIAAGAPARPGRVTLAALGAVAAAVGGVLGIGGGSLLAPALVAMFRHPTSQAATLALTITLTTSVAGLAAYTFFDAAGIGTAPAAPYWDVGLALGLGGLVGGLVGAALQHRIDERFLVAVLGTLSMVTAVSYLARG
ncbi:MULTISPECIES: TSUP family transporter [Micromonospora]|uniref:Probable membrane transporter protein n=1 Tax=Micromonospora yangpuensis TaxID=683228 RepID=A0A1C6U4H8_9ACTN|nr:TSUP family transporter [Micromonospora yangpuensis]GGL92564.1 hypothetical protein GCM10012279_07780 [Micromonospora yangpuensis]SCL48956.1 hypothetical protein GA0070617_1037 [Micromonospora yangpuensis]